MFNKIALYLGFAFIGIGWGVFDDTGAGTVSVCLMFGGLLMVIGSLKSDYDKDKAKEKKDKEDIKKEEG